LIEILSPTRELVAQADKADTYNDASYVLRFTHKTSRVLLASDVEEPAWQDMIEAGVSLRANVLIASHHGRKSGFSEDAMKLIRPEIVIVSTARLAPKDDAIDDYKRHSDHVFSTRVDGDLLVRMWNDGDLDVYDAFGNRLVRLVD
jgi:beta-lactamase superfamily II metal-dependent hydrolase